MTFKDLLIQRAENLTNIIEDAEASTYEAIKLKSKQEEVNKIIANLNTKITKLEQKLEKIAWNNKAKTYYPLDFEDVLDLLHKFIGESD